MKNIQEDISNRNFKRLYLLYGEEGYLKQQYRQKLLQALGAGEDAMNTAYYEGKSANPREIIDFAETVPFFAEYRVVVLQNTGFFKNKCEELADYLGGELPEYLCMIFVEEEVDKRSRMFKAVKKAGRAVEFARQDARTLTRWAFGTISREGKKITRGDMDYFMSVVGVDMNNISMELNKLLAYTLDRQVITREDIEAVCTPQIENKIFDMIRAVTDRNQERALQLYRDLLALREPPMRILYLLARQFNQLLQIREMTSAGISREEIAAKLKLPPFAVKNSAACASRYTQEQLRRAIEDCMSSEEAVKTGRLADTLSVELLIVHYSQENSMSAAAGVPDI